MNTKSETPRTAWCPSAGCGSLFDLVDDAILVHDASSGAVLDVNHAAEELYGASREAICAAGVEALSLGEPPYTASDALAHLRAAAAGTPQRFEWRARTISGRPFWVEITVKSVEAGGCDRLFAVVRDVTERKRADAALRESEKRFRLLAEAMPQIVCVLRTDGAAEYVSATWTEQSGLDLAGTRAAGWAGVLHPDDLAAARACGASVLRSQRPCEVELRYRMADGSYRWFLSRLAPVVERGRVVRLVGAAMDVDDRKRAEDAIRRSEEKFAKAFHGNAAGMAISRLHDDVFIDVNDTWAALGGYARDELVGRSSLALWMDARDRQAFVSELRRAGKVDRLECRARRKDGAEWTGLLSARVAGLGDEQAIISSIIDITDLKKAQEASRESAARFQAVAEALREADRRKNEFLGMLSHELRNPLAPIRNALYILEHAAPTGEQARRAKEVANRQIGHVTRLVDDLLDVTRIARGKIELRRADLDLGAVARRTADDYRAVMGERGLALGVDVPEGPVPVNGDETRLAQVLGNLLSNSAKFTPAGGRVTLSMRAEREHAVVVVRDSGPGIPSDVLPTIFEPFTQGKQSLARTEGGLGLGLALVKGLVELHGGEVRAVSGGPAGGTDVIVRLPLAPARQRGATSGPGPSGADGTPRRRVLVIDDNRDGADTVAELVGMLGHSAVVAYDAVAGLQLASEEPPDVVLCDLGLPGMDGYEFARRFRARCARQDVRLVALSGYAQPEDVARALEAGFDAHAAKPPDPARLEQLLAGPRAERPGEQR